MLNFTSNLVIPSKNYLLKSNLLKVKFKHFIKNIRRMMNDLTKRKNGQENKEKKRQGISLETKKKVIDDINANVDYQLIKTRYNLKNTSNISEIWKNREKYLAAYNDVIGSPFRKTLKKTKLVNIDLALRNFIIKSKNSGEMINDTILKEKALEIAKLSNNHSFKGSNGYLDNFKNRNKGLFGTFHGEATNFDGNATTNNHSIQLRDHIDLIDGFYKPKCLVEAIDSEYDVHVEFNKIKTQFNSVLPEEESISSDNFIGLDKHLSVCKPLNEVSQIQSEP